MGCTRAPTGAAPPRSTSASTRSTACWSWDARSPSASPDPGRGRGRCAATPTRATQCLETLSRALGATAATLTEWQDTFVAAGEASLATRSTDGEALETERLK